MLEFDADDVFNFGLTPEVSEMYRPQSISQHWQDNRKHTTK